MTFKQKIAAATGILHAPASYQILGDVMLLRFLKCSDAEKRKIAQCILELYPYVKTVCEIRGIEGELRQPSIRKFAGNGTETVHREYGILYKLDVSKVMFSKGNHFERQRLLDQVEMNEVIVDMFAGIGYFSLPLARHVRKVYAIEKNPVAFRYLQENVRLNRISNIEAINTDCRNAGFEGIADRVLMCYFLSTERFLSFALKILKDGGVIHFHNAYLESEMRDKPEEDLKVLGDFKILLKKKVKSIGPRKWHVVMDVEVKK